MGGGQIGIHRLGIAHDHRFAGHLHCAGGAQGDAGQGLPLPAAALVVVMGAVHLAHAGIEHGQHIGATMRLVGGVGHGQQAAHGQDGHLAAKGQALGHGAGGAQAGKSAGALSKNNSCKRLWGKR